MTQISSNIKEYWLVTLMYCISIRIYVSYIGIVRYFGSFEGPDKNTAKLATVSQNTAKNYKIQHSIAKNGKVLQNTGTTQNDPFLSLFWSFLWFHFLVIYLTPLAPF